MSSYILAKLEANDEDNKNGAHNVNRFESEPSSSNFLAPSNFLSRRAKNKASLGSIEVNKSDNNTNNESSSRESCEDSRK